MALILTGLSGCASMPDGTSVETLIGAQVRDGGFYPGHGTTVTLRLRQAITDRAHCEYEHVSHLLVGPPFGDKSEEDSLNQLACGVRFGGDD